MNSLPSLICNVVEIRLSAKNCLSNDYFLFAGCFTIYDSLLRRGSLVGDHEGNISCDKTLFGAQYHYISSHELPTTPGKHICESLQLCLGHLESL